MRENEEEKTGETGAVVGPCPLCKGRGRIRKALPFGANPKAPGTRADRLGFETCPRCKGRGRVGIE